MERVMEQAARTALARRVGRMTYDQVHTLLEENRAQRDAHSFPCPSCVWHTERSYARCAELATVPLLEINAHRRNCPTCQTVLRQWDHLDSCAVLQEHADLEHIYAQRLSYLRAKREGLGKFSPEWEPRRRTVETVR